MTDFGGEVHFSLEDVFSPNDAQKNSQKWGVWGWGGRGLGV